MAEMYGISIDLCDCRMIESVHYLSDCNNANWSSGDERWLNTFLIKGKQLHEDMYGQKYTIFPPFYWKIDDTDHMYREIRISDEEFPGSAYIQTGVGEVISSLDEQVRRIIGLMIFKRLDWNTYLGGIA